MVLKTTKLTQEYDETTRLTVWIVVLSIIFIAWILLIIGYFQFRKVLSLTIVKRRYPKIVLIESILSIIVTITYLPISLTFYCELDIFKSYQNILSRLTFGLYPLCHFIVFCEVCRLWLVCYDINYLHSSQNNVWKCQINKNYADKDWWLSHRSTYGNYDYVTKRMIIWGLTTGILSPLMLQIWGYGILTQSIDACTFGLPLLLLLYAYYKCPTLNQDLFLFSAEFRFTAMIFTSGLILYFMANIVLFFDIFIQYMIVNITGIFGFGGPSILSTLWIPRKILKKDNGIWTDRLQDKEDPHRLQSKSPSDINLSAELVEIFGDKEKLELFALHLNNEFSLECLLAFIEMVQFKKHFNEVYFKNIADCVQFEDKEIGLSILGGSELKSSIVYNGDDDVTIIYNCQDNDTKTEDKNKDVMRRFKGIAYDLYSKYIEVGSELEINISGYYRDKYNDLYNRDEWINNPEIISAEELLKLFDDVCMEMYKLMDYSFYRLKISDDYHE